MQGLRDKQRFWVNNGRSNEVWQKAYDDEFTACTDRHLTPYYKGAWASLKRVASGAACRRALSMKRRESDFVQVIHFRGGPTPNGQKVAILVHLAEQRGRFLPADRAGRAEAM